VAQHTLHEGWFYLIHAPKVAVLQRDAESPID
jgi:hypothetical protein